MHDSVTAAGSGVIVGCGESVTSRLGTGEDAALPAIVGSGVVVGTVRGGGTVNVERTGAAFVAAVVSVLVAAAFVASIVLVAADFDVGNSMADGLAWQARENTSPTAKIKMAKRVNIMQPSSEKPWLRARATERQLSGASPIS